VTLGELALSALPAFLASLVEFVEALTIVLAVGATRGWRPALIGTGAATLLLVIAVLVFGAALTRVPETTFKLVVGTLLVLFGMRWLRKACLRAAGVLRMHDELGAYEATTRALAEASTTGRERAATWGAIATAFNAVTVEGIEVVFIVIALGPTPRALGAASIGAALALIAVVLLGLALHRPLARVPENALKFVVGILLCTLGTFWMGEGLGFTWLGGDLGVPGLAAGYLTASAAAVAAASGIRKRRRRGAA
jgi:uncharacterized membrane protein